MKTFKTFILESSQQLSEEFSRSEVIPKKTITGYKLFRIKKNSPGKLFPLYVDANKSVPIGVWIEAKSGDLDAKGKVKSKLGPLAYRPGWHSGTSPVATHIGSSDSKGGKPVYRAEDQVWAEVEIPADVDWQKEAYSRGKKLKNDSKTSNLKKGDIDPKTAHITDQIPVNGHYKYKTNPNMSGEWIISGEIKVVRVLTDKEVEQINKSHGVKDLPRKTPVNISEIGF